MSPCLRKGRLIPSFGHAPFVVELRNRTTLSSSVHLVLRHLGEAAGNFDGHRLARKNGMNWVIRGGWYHLFMLNHPMLRFLVFWAVNTLSLWVADDLFDGISFDTPQSLFIAGLLLGVVNTLLRPLLLVLTLPLSILTLGVFVLVINALMLLLVAWLVPGFIVDGFWSGFWVAIFVAVFSFILNSLIGFNKVRIRRIE